MEENCQRSYSLDFNLQHTKTENLAQSNAPLRKSVKAQHFLGVFKQFDYENGRRLLFSLINAANTALRIAID